MNNQIILEANILLSATLLETGIIPRTYLGPGSLLSLRSKPKLKLCKRIENLE
jgi:hypothetical protein